MGGEGNETEIWVELSGASPEYPVSVSVNVNVNGLTSVASQDDFNETFIIENTHTVIIEEGQAGLKNKIVVPILEDNQLEGDELLVFEITSLVNTQASSDLFVISEQQKNHELTLTEDFDHDGLPDVCNLTCQELGLVADLDNDNDGIENQFDAFEFNAAASVDTDNDGQPDVWPETCLAQCQADSGLVQDPFLNDTDNDGAPNSIDIDFTNDNGKPILLTAPGTMHLAANNVDGSSLIVDAASVEALIGQLSAMDAVDDFALLTAKAYLNDVEIQRDENGEVTLPTGLLSINWVAVDSSGNESEPLEQLVYVYPQVRFTQLASLGGEGNETEIWVELSGASPEYPVSVNVNVNALTSVASQDDFNETFIIENTHTVIIEEGQAGLKNKIVVPILEDNQLEGDELLVFEITSLVNTQASSDLFVISEQQKNHELTLTEDFDHDGLPDVCNLTCQELGLVADLDNDNDGIENQFDAFEFNAAASVDTDNDGQPDVWPETCLAQCQADSGLVQDSFLNDTDNDGAPNDVDFDFERDDGKPTLLTVPDTIHVAVNTVDGGGVIVDADTINWHFSQLLAEDVIDSSEELSAKAYLNNIELVPDENGEVILPSGLLAINWVAVDTSGNESEPLIQLVYVYPQVRFKSITSTVGEASEAEIIVELTGDSPEYPVTVALQVNGLLSSIVQDDLGGNFDLSAIHTVVIDQGNNPDALNREGLLRVSILEDNISENDEYLVVELKSVVGVEQSTHEYIVLTKQYEAHELIVTYRNLAPTVEVLVLQNNQAVTSIALDGGQVNLVAIVSDNNGSDRHTYSWNLDGIVVDDLTSGSVVFEPSNFEAREYQVSVTVTDNSSNPLSGSITQAFTLVDLNDISISENLEEKKAPVDEVEVAAEASSGSSGGGAMSRMLLLLMTLMVMGRFYRRDIFTAKKIQTNYLA